MDILTQYILPLAFGSQLESNNTGSQGNGTISAPASPPVPANLSSLINVLFSFSALHDWLKIFVIGGFFETCRRLLFSSYHKIIGSFFITAHFQEDDSSYDWMMVWLSKQVSWSQSRELQISTRTFGLNSSAVLLPGEEEDADSLMNGNRKLTYLPSVSSTHTVWYKRRWMSVTRTQKDTGYYGRSEETLEISIMTRHHRILNELLLEAKKEYMAAQEHNISIYVSDSSNSWRHVATRPKRPLRSIVLDPGIKDILIDDARDFLESKTWYAARGIPFRRGYLLHGAPGSGKTSIIHSLAGELGLDVYIISLSRTGLDDTSLSELTSELPEKCIALMEDIDAAFTQSLNRDTTEGSSSDTEPPNDSPVTPGKGSSQPPRSGSRVSLSGLLNALDGVGAQEGRILFATTNKYKSLDPALCRPGRMDIHVEFKLASHYQARELYRCFYLPVEDLDAENIEEKGNSDSGYASSVDTDTDDAEIPNTVETVKTIVTTTEAVTFTGRSHRDRGPKLSRSQVTKLANQFAENIPERTFSMASLQGYLMAYKTRPLDAVKDVAAWVAKERLSNANPEPLIAT
ncbi:P-loop containing nucleoside triphosphate hydrolase protein [Collybia nuda]|uniref:P-loop containing nucleoside triphosphate hydrolase protein n=1 Tax=Collybia nuda TaxID=64659 RepID=A0A9P6CHE7_9AGAR|nr:P-loop containing nucleoside triphosphate hydrolase protein [Collybia nuda]